MRGRQRLGRVLGVLLLAAPLVGSAQPATADPAASPELVPFAGGFRVTATWGAPSGGYHAAGDPAIDVAMPVGTPLFAAGAGTVTQAVEDRRHCDPRNYPNYVQGCIDAGYGGSGVRVRVRHDDGRTSLYLHLDRIEPGIANGVRVAAGQRLGTSGNTGISEGPHLHYAEFDAAGNDVDPGAWVACHGSARVVYDGMQGRKGQVIRNDGYACSGGGSRVPFGAYDEALSPEAGRVRVRGWAIDDDARTSPVTVHAYVGGQAGQPGAEGHDLGPASASRPDVAAAHGGAGEAHGLDATFDTGKTGEQQVCVYAINIGGGTNPLLGCRTVTIADPQPFGSFDEALGRAGAVRVRGWTADRSAPTTPTRVHVYVGGQAGQPGAEGHDIGEASVDRPDVAAVHPWAGARHGFDTDVRTAKRGSQTVCAYAIDLGAGDNQLLGCRTATITEPAVATPTPTPTRAPSPAPAPSTPPTPAPSEPAPSEPAPSEPAPSEPAPSEPAGEVETSLTLSPSVISAGQVVTVTWSGTPGATLDVLARTQPATAYSRIRSVVLDGTGRATTTHRPQRNTRLAARTASGTVSATQPLVAVRSVASLSVRRTGTLTYAFSGRVYPARTGRLVNLYRDGRLVGQARTDASGVYGVTRRLGAGTSTFQAVTGDDTYNLGTRSPARRLTVG